MSLSQNKVSLFLVTTEQNLYSLFKSLSKSLKQIQELWEKKEGVFMDWEETKELREYKKIDFSDEADLFSFVSQQSRVRDE